MLNFGYAMGGKALPWTHSFPSISEQLSDVKNGFN